MTWESIVLASLGLIDAALSIIPIGAAAKATARAVLDTCRAGLLEAIHPDHVIEGAADGVPGSLVDNTGPAK